MKILMVCLGNICRSPLAEGILKQKIEEHKLDWLVESAGTGSWHIGELPDPRSVHTARNKGIDITDQRARQLKPADLDSYDLILAMDSSNYNDIVRYAFTEEQKVKVQLIMNYLNPDLNENVPDPYWDDNGFEKVYDMLNAACEKIIRRYTLEKEPG